MRRAGLAIAALAALPTLASAQTVDTGQGRIELLGQAPSACLLRSPVALGALNAALDGATASGAEIRIVQLANPQTAQAQAASIDLALPVVCNAAHRLTIRSLNGGLLRDGGTARAPGPVDGLGEFVSYRLSARWAGTETSVESAVTNLILIESANAATGDVQLRFAVAAGGSALIAGRYADAIIVEFQAAN